MPDSQINKKICREISLRRHPEPKGGIFKRPLSNEAEKNTKKVRNQKEKGLINSDI